MTIRKPINEEPVNPNRYGTERAWVIAAVLSAVVVLLPLLTLARLIAAQ